MNIIQIQKMTNPNVSMSTTTYAVAMEVIMTKNMVG